jgi:hypothetical protein
MTQATASVFKIPTEFPQLARGAVSRARKAATVRPKAPGLAVGRVVGVETVPPPAATGKSSSSTSGSPCTRPGAGRPVAGGLA